MVSELSAKDGTAGVVGLAAGFLLGFLTNHILRRLKTQDVYYESDDDDEPPTSYRASGEEHRLILCVRTDLKMQKGKIAAQVGHATLGAFKAAARRAPAALKTWEVNAQPKIAVQIRSYKEAQQLQRHANSLGLVTYMVYDAGKTQIAAGSMTVLAVGPGPVSLVNQVTGKLRLL
ncbi:Peptidyl-tRNA hydrolase 2, mitochondrial [Gracilariopsis chorda]|uniref:peptidyl-tRNA hydrolase n=1 Tax=Gracilariopsis chorda TaxID=448386 RepID=A0A2V3ISN2_9FLOR|nr:Peptidyl-tRNA hydrolase 2, mitochondrial [Gracilariopsis chorda]|eukprot:PXF45112.1 Peptidyl-tRNA hydrolase 2, mitochondrial [Gracilariopsis chorda]